MLTYFTGALPIGIRKRFSEGSLWQVQFFNGSTTAPIISALTVQVVDETTQADVTTSLTNTANNTFSGNVATFYLTGGTQGSQYSVFVNATMADGEVLVAEFFLTILVESVTFPVTPSTNNFAYYPLMIGV
jgi:hypothetical protein